jgi:hypothetical protein
MAGAAPHVGHDCEAIELAAGAAVEATNGRDDLVPTSYWCVNPSFISVCSIRIAFLSKGLRAGLPREMQPTVKRDGAFFAAGALQISGKAAVAFSSASRPTDM